MAAAPTLLSYPLYDADQHYYEAADAFTRHLEPRHRGAFQWVKAENGRTRLLVNQKLFKMIANPTFDPVGKPGALAAFFRGRNEQGADAKKMMGKMEPIRPEYRDRAKRIAVMDAQGIHFALLLPTLALGVEELCKGDPPALFALLRAFNQWIDDEWGFARDERIHAPPVLSLVDSELACAELERVLRRGARWIVFRPAPVVGPTGSRSPADPAFDRFWAMAAEAGVVAAYHSADSGYARVARDWGETKGFETYVESPFIETLSLFIERPITETLAALVCHGLFDRHPRLRVATIELGSAWARDLLRRLSMAYGKLPHTFARHPVETFKRQIWLTPFMEDEIFELVDLLGAERVLFGSDWPHPEGVAEPRDFEADVAKLSPAQKRRVMSDNLRELLSPPR